MGTCQSLSSSMMSSNVVDHLPVDVYSHVWKFLIDVDDPPDGIATLDTTTITSFRLVNKVSKQAFEECQGWCRIAYSLATQASNLSLEVEAIEAFLRYVPAGTNDITQVLEDSKSRLYQLEHTALPAANRLVVNHGGNEVHPSLAMVTHDGMLIRVRVNVAEEEVEEVYDV